MSFDSFHSISSQAQPSFLLEKLVHSVLRDDAQRCHMLMDEALRNGLPETSGLAPARRPHDLLADVLWPAAECVQQLRHDRLVSARAFNAGVRLLSLLTARLTPLLSPAACDTTARGSLFIMSAPGEPSDLGAQILSVLAESHAFKVHFAGARLIDEEIIFAINKLEPQALVIHGSLVNARKETAALLKRLKEAGLWPRTQLAVVGTVAAASSIQTAHELFDQVDVRATDPTELLEMLALFPDYRAAAKSETLHSPLLEKPLDLLQARRDFLFFPDK